MWLGGQYHAISWWDRTRGQARDDAIDTAGDLGIDCASDDTLTADVQGVWAVHFFPEGLQADESALYHAFLLVSTRTGTKVLRNGEELDELGEQAGFVLDSRTIFAGNLLRASRIVQVFCLPVAQCPVLPEVLPNCSCRTKPASPTYRCGEGLPPKPQARFVAPPQTLQHKQELLGGMQVKDRACHLLELVHNCLILHKTLLNVSIVSRFVQEGWPCWQAPLGCSTCL